MTRLRLLLVSLVIFAILPSSAAGDTTSDYVRLAGGDNTIPLGASHGREHPRLESVLAELATFHTANAPASLALALSSDSIRVIVEAEVGVVSDVSQGIAARGGQVEGTSGGLIQVVAPVASLPALALLPGVRFVRRPLIAEKLDLSAIASHVTSEGVAAIGANAWQAAGFRGQGVKIAVLDVGFSGYQTLLAGADVAARSFRADGALAPLGGEQHGTAVAEIVHSVAPDASLLLLAFDTEVEWANAVDFAVASGVPIITSSIGFLLGPFDGTGFFSDKVNAAHNSGVFWTQAAGNFATSHWAGDFADTDGNGLLDFAPGVEQNGFRVPPNAAIQVVLNWNDWPASNQNYDLLLYQQIGDRWQLVDQSNNVQSGSQPPIEVITGRSISGGLFAAAVRRVSATRPVRLQLYTPDFTPQFTVVEGSLATPADAQGAEAVGATHVGSDALEPFSSRGPTVDGRVKPDLAAPDGVSTGAFLPEAFLGTSASAPHVAGAAALIKSANPALSNDGIRAFVEGRALDLGPTGKDNAFGSGRLALGAPAGAANGGVDAKIEIVFPHDASGNPGEVVAAPLANVGAFAFAANTLAPVACDFASPVRLFRALNNGVAEPVATGSPSLVQRNGRSLPLWQFNDVDVSAAADPLNKYYFFLSVDGVDANTNVWSHGVDARTIFPQQDTPTGVAALGNAVDAKIEVVFPHDAQGNERSVAEADLVNLAVDLFLPNSLVSVAPGSPLTVRLLRSLNNEVAQVVATGKATTLGRGTFSQPRWAFDNVDVSAAKSPANKYYFRIAVDGLATRSNVWSHGADARTIFPQQDVPAASCR